MNNIAAHLTAWAKRQPEAIAVAMPGPRVTSGTRRYTTLTFADLDRRSDHVAQGLLAWGVAPGTRLALLQPPSLDFFVLVFGLLKAGVVQILIDPGMGRRNLVRSLASADPAGFVGIAPVHWLRRILRRRFPHARYNVTTSRRWLTGAQSLAALESQGAARCSARDVQVPGVQDAAIIFTTGSTGPPKGVLYSHENFLHQVTQIQEQYQIEPGERDLPGFPLFGLFNAAMGVTTVVPDMDPTRPARVNPELILAAAEQWQVTQTFGSPAIWNRVGHYCVERRRTLPTLRRVLSAGAPVPPRVLSWMRQTIAPGGEMHTPYGATEALPVASISASEVLGETAALSAQGRGTCVGRRFSEIEWEVIAIHEGPLASLADATRLPRGTIGELIVRGPVVTRAYATSAEATRWAKIADGDRFWHRMGDVGYLDATDRFWFCGRMAHRVVTATEVLYTIPCEAIFNNHPQVFRSALVGVGRTGAQTPVLIVEPWSEQFPRGRRARAKLIDELRVLGQQASHTRQIEHFLIHRRFPVDIRHNAKIFRERLAVWASKRINLVGRR